MPAFSDFRMLAKVSVIVTSAKKFFNGKRQFSVSIFRLKKPAIIYCRGFSFSDLRILVKAYVIFTSAKIFIS
jgi:hypothetical protein